MTIELNEETLERHSLTIHQAAVLIELGTDPDEHDYRLEHDETYSAYFHDRFDAQEAVAARTDALVEHAVSGGVLQVTQKVMRGENLDPRRTLLSKQSLVAWCECYGYTEVSEALRLNPERQAKHGIAVSKTTQPVHEVADLSDASKKLTDWTVEARAIADEYYEKDMKAGVQDSLMGYSERVAKEMRNRDINGQRGLLTPNTVKREALQSDKWWQPRLKKRRSESGGAGGAGEA